MNDPAFDQRRLAVLEAEIDELQSDFRRRPTRAIFDELTALQQMAAELRVITTMGVSENE
jgi:hypothetical protein